MEFDDLPQIDDYASLFINNTPMLDVRAPVEYQQGAFPHTQNLPLMDDEDRHEIGIQYKNEGQDSAIELGKQRVSGEVLEARVNRWTDYTDKHPEGVLYCFRGGMRSKISQQLIFDKTGVAYPRVKGGYKALRRYLIDQIEESVNSIQPIILGGRTGTGKTVLLPAIRDMIDLEGIYHHRGSVFGIHATPQPSQIDVENSLSIELLKRRHRHIRNIVFEDESANIGSRRLPENLFNAMKQSPIVLLEASNKERVDITFDEYVTNALGEYQQYHGEEEGFNRWIEYQFTAIDKIQRRLGGVKHKQLREQLDRATTQYRDHADPMLYRQWIHDLLVDYYDPMYDYQLSKKLDRVVFEGHRSEVLNYLSEEYSITLA